MNGGEEGGEGVSKGGEGGPFVDAPHLSAGSFTLQSVEAPPFTAGWKRAGAKA